MIDIHSHILYGIDDGAKDREMTLEMLKIAAQDGIRTIIATPHYVTGANRYNREKLLKRYQEVTALIEEEKLPINLLLGNEIYLDEYLIRSLQEGQCLSLGETSYLLIEFPMLTLPPFGEQVLYALIKQGYRPIIAHPERYGWVQQDLNAILPFIKMGCLTQVNSTSIEGTAGEGAREAVKQLLQHHLVSLAATDCHSHGKRRPVLSRAYLQVKRWIGEAAAEEIFLGNPRNILEDQPIATMEPRCIEVKKPLPLHHRLLGYFRIAK